MDIMEMKKEKDRLVFEKEKLWDTRLQLEEAVLDACQHVYESTMKLNVVEKEKWLGAFIAQSQ